MSSTTTDNIDPEAPKIEEASETWTQGEDWVDADVESGEFTFQQVEAKRQLEKQTHRRCLKAAGVVVALIVAIAVVVPLALLVVQDDDNNETIDISISTTTAMETTTESSEILPSDTKLATENISTSPSTPSSTSSVETASTIETTTTTTTTNSPNDEWPGAFPNDPHGVTINIYTDSNPQDVYLEWSVQDEYGLWQSQHFVSPFVEHSLHRYHREVLPSRSYRLRLVDSQGDGTCCHDGKGWFTLTNSTASAQHSEGTVLWSAKGDLLESFLEVYLWVDEEGRSMLHPALDPYVEEPSTTESSNESTPYDPSKDNEQWPGAFPSLPNAVTINIFTDDAPQELSWEWSIQNKATGKWKVLTSGSPTVANDLVSYQQPVEIQTTYRLTLQGVGWFTVTDTTTTANDDGGVVVWSGRGGVVEFMIDAYGHAHTKETIQDSYASSYSSPRNSPDLP